MISRKVFAVLVLALASTVTALSNARASEWDQATKVTFKQSIQIPGKVLPAGTYWFVIPRSRESSRSFEDSSDRSDIVCNAHGPYLLRFTTGTTRPIRSTIYSRRSRVNAARSARNLVLSGADDWTCRKFRYPKQDQKEIALAKKNPRSRGEGNGDGWQHTDVMPRARN